MKRQATEHIRNAKTLLLAIQAPNNRSQHIESYFEEFLNLVKTNGVVYEKVLYIKLRETDPSYFLTAGKLEEIKKICDELGIEHVIISDPLTPQQERNLSDFLECTVFDRTSLILEIFEKAAQAAEGKIQVALARLQHRRTRLAGKGIHLAQQAGMIGVRGGPGETLKERESRLIEEEVLKLKRELNRLARARETQRKQRQRSRILQLCLIGYTNTGKSTLLNALTKSNVLAEDKLFATLDTTTRELYIDRTKIGVISDTVGFIQNLPHTLIEAFKSTLSELQYADLLLHVVDISDPEWQKHIRVVHEVLEELQVDKDMVYVFNKIDKLSEHDLEECKRAVAPFNPHVLISAKSKDGLKPLRDFLFTWHENKTR
ncbi:MAG TPA: GTPase HflX [Candidatus Babeliales bacterium]|jgi:GTP-binding protein HflX|nr:GTPase HflX [Candidatus Babeliales bacterium]